MINKPKQSWKTWHHHFGYISYKGLKQLYHNKLTNGLVVDQKSSTLDCPSYIEAKLHIKLFNQKTKSRHKHKGKLTHIDLWGKYDISSISGHQYYLLLVDNAMQYVTMYFLKEKHEASQ